MQAELFTATLPLPEGFVYEPEYLAPEEEAALLDVIRTLPFEEAKYVMRDQARWGRQHSIAPTQEQRYSITLRTARRSRG